MNQFLSPGLSRKGIETPLSLSLSSLSVCRATSLRDGFGIASVNYERFVAFREHWWQGPWPIMPPHAAMYAKGIIAGAAESMTD